jgi:hypothetical protein
LASGLINVALLLAYIQSTPAQARRRVSQVLRLQSGGESRRFAADRRIMRATGGSIRLRAYFYHRPPTSGGNNAQEPTGAEHRLVILFDDHHYRGALTC